YAMLYTIPPNVRHIDELTKAQHEAREKKIGIWGNRGLKEVPSEYRKKHPRP
ncbi:MAG: thermonuclease family protein, partial [Nitrospira sp.]|nr:thermonuclease family protein [Nitrospira sp.]